MADYHIHDIGYEYTAKGRWDELACQVPPSSSFLLPPAYCQKSRKRFHQSSAPHTISFASKFHISMPLLRHVPTPKSNRIRTETRASDRLKSDTGSYIVERKKKRARNRSIGWILADAFKCEKSNHQIVNPPPSCQRGPILFSGTTFFQNGIGRTRRIGSLSLNFHLVYSAATRPGGANVDTQSAPIF